jgi:hypothetical protein
MGQRQQPRCVWRALGVCVGGVSLTDIVKSLGLALGFSVSPRIKRLLGKRVKDFGSDDGDLMK